MNKILREHYPVAKLPEDLRAGLDPHADVRIIVEQLSLPASPMSLDEIFAMRQPPFRTAEEIDSDLRRLRDEWDERG